MSEVKSIANLPVKSYGMFVVLKELRNRILRIDYSSAVIILLT